MTNIDKVKAVLEYDRDTGKIYRVFSGGIRKELGCAVGKSGHLITKVLGTVYRLHHLVWAFEHGYLPKYIDHIDGDPTNNVISNLRCVGDAENAKNRKRVSGKVHNGITRRPNGKWQVRINIDNRAVYLGVFGSLDEAIAVRKRAEVEHGYHENHGKEATPLSNTKPQRNPGVTWCAAANKWRARIKIRGVERHLGVFDSVDDARNARRAAELENAHG